MTRERGTQAGGAPENLVGLIRFPGTDYDHVGEFLRAQEQIVDITGHSLRSVDGVIDWAGAEYKRNPEQETPVSYLITAITGQPDEVAHAEDLLEQAPRAGVRSALILVLEPSLKALAEVGPRQVASHLSCLLRVLGGLNRYHHRICRQTTFVDRPVGEGGRILGLFPYPLQATAPRAEHILGRPASASASTDLAGDSDLEPLLAKIDHRCHSDLALAEENVVARELVTLLRRAGVR